jgi:hypothetical protein
LRAQPGSQKGGQKDGQKGGRKDGQKDDQKGGQKDGQTDTAIRKELEPEPELEREQTLPLIAEDDFPEPPESRTQHVIVRERIQELYKAANPGTPCPWDGRTGKSLKDTLDRLVWPDAALLAAVENRFASDGVVLSEDPHRWIPQLDRYRAGRLDRFNKPANGGMKVNANERLEQRLAEELEISARVRRERREREGS